MSKKQQTLSSFFGVSSPTKKRQFEPEKKKIQLFSEKWLQDVQWLEANDERTEMWCKI